MKQYLLSVMQPDGDPPPPEDLEPIVRNLKVFHDELHAAGAWVFAGGLHPADVATVVRVQDGDVLMTDGPYVEAKEVIVSFTIIQAEDYDAALAIARECPPGHTIEIREMAGYA